MEAFTLYLFKSAIWLAGFALVYLLFLRNERFFLLKRIYLVSGILISFLFPLISVHYQVELPAQNLNPVDFTSAGNPSFIAVPQVNPDKPFDYRYILLFLYLSGVLFFAHRLIWHIRSLYKAINKASINYRGPAKLIRASEFSFSFSFFNYVFVNPSVSEAEVEEIMNHELVHVRQRHWFDLLLVELLRLFQWVNPFTWIYTRFIRLNHEYIADEAALQYTSDPAIYRAVLLNQIFNSPVISLSNSFNYSLSKKRFDMMKKIITSPYRKLKVLFVLPVIAILLFFFATPAYHYSAGADNTMTILQAQAKVAKAVKGIVVNEEGNPIKGATVIISGTPTGVSTDASGHFTIRNVPEEAHLIISSKGCVSKYLEPVFSSEMTVKMLLDKGNPLSLLVRASFKNGPYPLTIINGVEINKRIDEIDENEISSMGVFFETNATDLFGEKGKNGVIFITTKKKSTESGTNKPAETNTATKQKPSASSTIVAKEVKGTVVQENGKPLQGANIVISGTFTGTSTDAKGYFHLGNVPDSTILEFTYIGFKPLRLKPEFSSGMTVKMIKNIKNLAPVIIKPGTPPTGNLNQNEFPLQKKVSEVKKQKTPVNKNINANNAQETGKEVFVVVEEMPSFPGGEIALNSWMIQNIKYPAKAASAKIEGNVDVSFIVKSSGKVKNVKVARSVNPLLDDEAVKVVSDMPDWKPGRQNGKAVDVSYNMPVSFKLK